MLSDDFANKVIVTTIQKLGIILDENSKRNKQKAEKGIRAPLKTHSYARYFILWHTFNRK
jgi:type I site-specific restriction-modification system R (restriction) subunit